MLPFGHPRFLFVLDMAAAGYAAPDVVPEVARCRVRGDV